MNKTLLTLGIICLTLSPLAAAETDAPPPPATPVVQEPAPCCDGADWKERAVSPVTNPLFFEDPHIRTEIRPIYFYHDIDDDFVGGDGRVHLGAIQARWAVTDRFALIATKDGYADIEFEDDAIDDLIGDSGWADVSVGMKYAVVQNDEMEFILTPGLKFEFPIGQGDIFQGNGDGEWDVFASAAKSWGRLRVLGSLGCRIPNDMDEETAQAHYSGQIDYETCRYFIPFLAVNAFTVLTEGENPDLTAVLGPGFELEYEGYDVINFGAADARGVTQVVGGVGFRSRLLNNGLPWTACCISENHVRQPRREFLKQTAAGMGLLGMSGIPGGPNPAAAASFLTGRPAMKLGTVTYNLGKDWDLPTLIERCETAGFEGVELRTTHAHKVEVNLNAAERAAVRERFRNSKVELMGLGSAFDYHTPDQEKLRRDMVATKEYIRLAHDVGAGGVKVRPNGLPPEVPPGKTLDQIGRCLRELGQFADGLGVQIRLEVHGRETALLPNIRTILDVADHPAVGACWNCNDTDLAGEGFEHNFDLVKDRIFVVHMRDLYLEDYPFRKLFTRLQGIGFQGYCLAEIPPSDDPVRVMKYYRALWLAYQDLL